MGSSMAEDYGGGFKVHWNLRQANLQDVGFTQVQANLVEVKGLQQLFQLLDETHGPSHSHGHDTWLVCEVALRFSFFLNKK